GSFGGGGGFSGGGGGGGGFGGASAYNATSGGTSGSGGGGGGGAIGADAGTDLEMATTWRPGSAGGGGGGHFNSPFGPTNVGGGGGGGGGALRIASATQINNSGVERADGGGGGSQNGGGGGGSGGAIFLAAPSIAFVGGAAASAVGAPGGSGGSGAPGGSGGLGRILLSANSLTTAGASFNPPIPPVSNGPGYTYVTSYCLNTPTPTPTETGTPTNTPTNTPSPTATVLTTIVGHVTWQGRAAAPSIYQQLPLTLTIRMVTPTITYPMTLTDPSGFFTVTTALPPGSYYWRVKGPTFLSTAGPLVLTGAPTINVEMGLQRTGDLTGDNVVNATDFSLLKTNFGAGGDP
ncbi:MAG: hypothetical protein ACJ78Q_06265, partial [Chloroflexia bacterium]